MSVALANVTTGDAYTAGATLSQSRSEQLLVQIANAAVFYQLDLDEDGHGLWEQQERFVLPSIGSLSRRCGGIRFRSAVAGSPAQVSCELLTADDVGGGDQLSPFSGTVRPSGAVGAGLNVPTIALGNFPPANPTEGDVYELILPATFDPLGNLPVRWLVQFDASNAIWQVSGRPLRARVATSESITAAANTWGDLATDGPIVTIPRGGRYAIRANVQLATAGGATVDIAVTVGNVAGAEPLASASQAAPGASMVVTDERALVTNNALKIRYRSANAPASPTVSFKNRQLEVTPLTLT